MSTRSGPASQPSPEAMAQYMASGAANSIKVHEPDIFDGNRKDLPRFLAQLRLYFGFKGINGHEPQVLFAISYLKGSAYNWIGPCLEEFLTKSQEERRKDTRRIFGDYDEFVRRLKGLYGKIDIERSAQRKLDILKQNGSAAKCTAEFQQLSSHVHMEQATLTWRYYTGLKDHVKDEIAKHDWPESFKEIMDTAIRVDNRHYERFLQKHGSKKGVPMSKTTYKSVTQDYGDPMELATMQRKKLSNTERQNRMKNNLCLYCGKPGHKARECKAKKQLNATGKRSFPRRQLNATGTGDNQGTPAALCTHGNNCYDRNCTTHGKRNREHAALSWTACYDDNCLTHISEKEGAGWYPKKRRPRQRQLNATSHGGYVNGSPENLDYDDDIPDLVPDEDQQSEDDEPKTPDEGSPMLQRFVQEELQDAYETSSESSSEDSNHSTSKQDQYNHDIQRKTDAIRTVCLIAFTTGGMCAEKNLDPRTEFEEKNQTSSATAY